MKLLTYGSRGPQVQFLQLALNRAGCGPVATDGIYGCLTAESVRKFQQQTGISANGVAGQRTHHALCPYYTGYITHAVCRGDTFYNLAKRYHTSLHSIEVANPNLHASRLRVGTLVTVPLSFPVVPTSILWSSEVLDCVIDGLTARYPFLRSRSIGRSVMGKKLYALSIGCGPRKVLYNATHHANEWITTPILLRFAEEFSSAYAKEGLLHNIPAAEIFQSTRFILVPCVNPDGMDLVTGYLTDGTFFQKSKEIARRFPNTPFPSGWKANMNGVDLNLQYPAAWEQAKEIKYAQGYDCPAPRDYAGTEPLTQPESRAMTRLTELFSPDRILAYHTQGDVIYPNFLDFNPQGAMPLAWRLAAASGYDVMQTPYESAYAGYKDWFIQTYNRPGYTIEAGKGTSPLPIEDFDAIYAQNLPILVLTATLDT